MVESTYLASTLVMGLLVVGVVVLVLRARGWHHYRPQAAYGQLDAGGGGRGSAVGRFVNDPGVWTLTFFALALGLMAGTTVYVSGASAAMAGPAIMGALGALMVGFVVASVYAAVRSHGRPVSQAVGASAVALGALFLLGLTIKLVLA